MKVGITQAKTDDIRSATNMRLLPLDITRHGGFFVGAVSRGNSGGLMR